MCSSDLRPEVDRGAPGRMLEPGDVAAVERQLDRDHPPAAPAVHRGLDAIRAYYQDICGRNVNHQVRDVVATPDGFAFTQHCSYPDGTAVLCATVARTQDGKIRSQTAVQVWDS